MRSYGPQTLRIYPMSPELGPPDIEDIDYDTQDGSWEAEWLHFRTAINGAEPISLLGSLDSAAYAWSCVEAAYACR